MLKEESQLGRIETIYRRKVNVTRVGSLCKKCCCQAHVKTLFLW